MIAHLIHTNTSVKNFKAEVGIEFNDWKAGRTNTSNDPEQVILEDESYKVKCSGDSPYWKVFKNNFIT